MGLLSHDEIRKCNVFVLAYEKCPKQGFSCFSKARVDIFLLLSSGEAFFFCSFYWSFAEAVFSSKCFFSWVFLSCLVGVQTNWKGSTFEGSAKSVVFLLESSLDGWLVTNVENEVLEMLDLSSVIETISIPCKCI